MTGNFLVTSALKSSVKKPLNSSQERSDSSQKPSKSSQERTKIRQPNGNLQMYRPKRFININDRFTRISTNVPVARNFNLPSHSIHSMTICSLSQHLGNTEGRKTPNQNLPFNVAFLSLTESINASPSTNLFICSYHHFSTNGIVSLHLIRTHNHQSLHWLWRWANVQNVSFAISLRRNFDPSQLVWHQIWAFHLPTNEAPQFLWKLSFHSRVIQV